MAVVISLPLFSSFPGLRSFLSTAAFLQAALLWGSDPVEPPLTVSLGATLLPWGLLLCPKVARKSLSLCHFSFVE